jgi:hypothetical protein
MWMQAGNTEAATSAGIPQRATSEATVKQQCLSEGAEESPLHGLRFKLERKADLRNGCCTTFAVVHRGQGHTAELRCAGCSSYRGRLPKEAANWLCAVLTHFPAAKMDVHVIRVPPSPPRVAEQGNHRRETKGTENE